MLIEIINGAFAPAFFGILVAGAIVAIWMSLSPAGSPRAVTDRMTGMVDTTGAMNDELQTSFAQRLIVPVFHRFTGFLAGLMPQKNVDKLNTMLIQAGSPGGLTAMDFVGIRFVLAIGAGAGYFLIMGHNDPFFIAIRNSVIALFVGFMFPKLWLNQRIKQRKVAMRRRARARRRLVRTMPT